MNASQRMSFEKFLLAERERHERTLARVAGAQDDPPADRGRIGDDLVVSTAGVSADDDRAVVAHTSRELESIDRALTMLHTDPSRFGKCAACARPIPLERLRLVPGTTFCQTHAHD